MYKINKLSIVAAVAGLCFSVGALAAPAPVSVPVGLQTQPELFIQGSLKNLKPSNNIAQALTIINNNCNNQVKMVVPVAINVPDTGVGPLSSFAFRLAGVQLVYMCEQSSSTDTTTPKGTTTVVN